MRTIDADALKELFSEVIGHIAKKPEMNGNLEHMIRASAMVIQMIDDAPTVNALNCSEIPNNSDTISRQAVTKFLNDWLSCLFENCHKQSASDLKMIIKDFKNLPSAQPETNCSEIPNNWIPCSERLPEDEYVLISKKPSKISGDKWCVAIAIRTADPRSRKIQWRDSGFGIIPDDKVLAWMPLPEPWKGEEDETD